MKSINNTILFEDERVDGADKVTGKAKYTAEHKLPNMANAVYNATGKRVRDLPITPEKLGYKTLKA